MPNIEIKAKVQDIVKARATAVRLGGKFLWEDSQTDTYFQTKSGKLKLRESGLNGSELIPYLKSEAGGLKRSDYARLAVKDASLVKSLFRDLLGQKLEVKKIREVFLLENVRVHLDTVEGLGDFIEFEAVFDIDTPSIRESEHRKVRALMNEFEIPESNLLDGSYPDLLAQADSLPKSSKRDSVLKNAEAQ